MKTEIKTKAPVAHDLIAQKVAYISDLAVAADGSYVKVANSLPQNLTALDTAIKNIPAQTDYTLTIAAPATPDTQYAAQYEFKQCGNTLATINIPKDMVVQEGSVVDITFSENKLWDGATDVTEKIKGAGVTPTAADAGKYVKLVIANKTDSTLYIKATDLVDVYTAEQNATQVQLAINNNVISATIVAGSVGTTELSSGVNDSLVLANNAVQRSEVGIVEGTGAATITVKENTSVTVLTSHQDISGKADKSEMTVTPGTGTDADKTTIQLKSGTSATVLTAHQDISGKADASDLTAHTGNTDIHVTTADKTAWNGAVTTLGTHTADTTVHITAAERTAWDAKYDLPSGGITTADLASGVVASLGKADTALQASDLDNTTIEKDATAGVRVKAGSITEAHLSTSVNASLDKADNAYQKPSTGIAKTDLASDVQTSLGKADTALQASDITGKADKVANATSGNFAGLDANGNLTDSGSKAADFATAAQGAKADTAVQPGNLGDVAPTSADNSTIEVSGTTLRVKDGGIGTAKVADGAVTTAKLATLTSFKLVDTANDGAPYQGQVYQITIDHGVLTVTPVA